MLKLSEMAVATSNVLANLIPKYLDNVSCFCVLPTTILEYMHMAVALHYPRDYTSLFVHRTPEHYHTTMPESPGL